MSKRLNLTVKEKMAIYEKFGGCCAYCGRKAKNVMNMTTPQKALSVMIACGKL